MITNSMNVGIPEEGGAGATCVHESEVTKFLHHKSKTFHLWVVSHELFDHGTGKLIAEDGPRSSNFDAQNLPINPLTGKPIDSWYCPGQTWTGLFGDIATSVDECRAECVGAYLMSEMELLALFGFSETTEIKGSNCGLSPPPPPPNLYARLSSRYFSGVQHVHAAGCRRPTHVGKLHIGRSCKLTLSNATGAAESDNVIRNGVKRIAGWASSVTFLVTLLSLRLVRKQQLPMLTSRDFLPGDGCTIGTRRR